MRRLRRCVVLLGLAWVEPMQAGRTGAQLPVTATIVSSCRSIGVAGSWTRATLPADPSRWVTVDCADGTAYRVRGVAPSAPPQRPAAAPVGARTSVSEIDGTVFVTIEF